MAVDNKEGLDIEHLLRSKKVRLRKSEDDIKEFRKRDLKASQLKRIKNKINGKKVCHEQKRFFSNKDRDQYFNQLILDSDYVFPYYYKKEEKKEEDSFMVDDAAEREEAQDRQLRRDYDDWMGRRCKLVEDMKNMGLNYHWLSRKPLKSQVELRVLQSLMLRNKREIEKQKMQEIRQKNKQNSHRFEDTFYLKKDNRKSTFQNNKKLLQKIQVQALSSSESSLFLPPVSPYNADLMQLKRDRKNVEYKTDVNGNLTVRNENIRIPSHLLSRDELMRNVEWARQTDNDRKLQERQMLNTLSRIYNRAVEKALL